jgi:hypothetical protein
VAAMRATSSGCPSPSTMWRRAVKGSRVPFKLQQRQTQGAGVMVTGVAASAVPGMQHNSSSRSSHSTVHPKMCIAA